MKMKVATPSISNIGSLSTIPAFNIKQLLVGIEVGQSDTAVLNYLNFLTKQIPTEAFHFLHVFREDGLLRTFYEQETEMVIGKFKIDEAMINDIKDNIKKHIENIDSKSVKYQIKEGNSLEILSDTAKNIAADLVVIGQNSYSIHHHILAGNLVRLTTCNTLVIPSKAVNRLKSILVPIDFSPHAIKAIQTAIGINRQLAEPAKIICLSLYDVPNLSIYETSRTNVELRKLLEKDRADAFAIFLDTHVPNELDRRNIVTTVMEKRTADIGTGIVEYADNQNIDLTIMGAKGHSKAHLLIMGSVAEQVLLLNKNQPVLMIK